MACKDCERAARRVARLEAEAKEARAAVVHAASRVVVRERGRRPVVSDPAAPAMAERPGWGWEGGYGPWPKPASPRHSR